MKTFRACRVACVVVFLFSFLEVVAIVWVLLNYQYISSDLDDSIVGTTKDREKLEVILAEEINQSDQLVSIVQNLGENIAQYQNAWRDASGIIDSKHYDTLVDSESSTCSTRWNIYYLSDIGGCKWEFISSFPVDLIEIPMTWLFIAENGEVLGYAFGIYVVEDGLVHNLECGEFKSTDFEWDTTKYNSPAGDVVS